MCSVFVICPSHELCGGDPATDERAAERYAERKTGIVWYSSVTQDKQVKFKCRSFFYHRNVREPAADYVCERRWTFPTKSEAQKKVAYEAANCGHFVRSNGSWVQL